MRRLVLAKVRVLLAVAMSPSEDVSLPAVSADVKHRLL